VKEKADLYLLIFYIVWSQMTQSCYTQVCGISIRNLSPDLRETRSPNVDSSEKHRFIQCFISNIFKSIIPKLIIHCRVHIFNYMWGTQKIEKCFHEHNKVNHQEVWRRECALDLLFNYSNGYKNNINSPP
jgi:hypothetical protein